MSTAQSRDLLGVLESLEDLRSNDASARRAFRRFVVRGDAHLLPMDRAHLNPNPVEIKLRDISRGGLGFISTTNLEAGSSWRIVFFHEGFAVGEQGAIIRHTREIQPGLYLTGAAFIINSGILSLLGIDPTLIDEPDHNTHDIPADFTDPLH